MSAALDAEQEAKLRAFFDARRAAGLWSKEADRLRLELEEAVSTAEPDSFANEQGEYVGRVRHVTGKRFNTKKLKAERPDIYAEFEEETLQVRIEEPK